MRSGTDATLEQPGRADRSGPNLADPLIPLLASVLLEQLVERTEIRAPRRMVHDTVPALAVTVGTMLAHDADPIDAVAPDVIAELAVLTITSFIERGFLAVVRPNRRPVFVHPLPALTGPECDADEVVRMCRQLDDERLRRHVLDAAERFTASVERKLRHRGVVIEVRLGEGVVTGEPGPVSALLPAARWKPA